MASSEGVEEAGKKEKEWEQLGLGLPAYNQKNLTCGFSVFLITHVTIGLEVCGPGLTH